MKNNNLSILVIVAIFFLGMNTQTRFSSGQSVKSQKKVFNFSKGVSENIKNPTHSRGRVGFVKFLSSNLQITDSKSILQIKLKNAGEIIQRPLVWAELYDLSGKYITRFEGDRIHIFPGETELVNIEMSNLQVGNYKALIVGRYVSYQSSDSQHESISLLKSFTTIELPVSHSQFLEIPTPKPEPFFKNQADDVQSEKPESDLSAFVPDVTDVKNHFDLTTGSGKTQNDVNRLKKLNEQIATPRRIERTPRIKESSSTKTKDIAYEYYTVKKGDWLSKIAKAYYGDALKYGEIFKANRDILKNPNLIFPGQKLKIPRLSSQDSEISNAQTNPPNNTSSPLSAWP